MYSTGTVPINFMRSTSIINISSMDQVLFKCRIGTLVASTKQSLNVLLYIFFKRDINNLRLTSMNWIGYHILVNKYNQRNFTSLCMSLYKINLTKDVKITIRAKFYHSENKMSAILVLET